MKKATRALVAGFALLAATASTANAETWYYPGGFVTITSPATDWLGQSLISACNSNPSRCMGVLERWVPNIDRAGNFSIGQTRISYGPVTTTPEPFTMALLGTGLAGIGLAARRRRREQGELV